MKNNSEEDFFMIVIWISLGISFLVALMLLLIRNTFLKRKLQIKETFAEIDVCLKQKANILQNLLDTINQHTEYEGELLSKIASARSGLQEGETSQRIRSSDEISNLLPSLYAVVERYPKLGANDTFANLAQEIEVCENKVLYARRRYNLTVVSYNFALMAFPTCFVARKMKLQPESVYELLVQDRTAADDFRVKEAGEVNDK
jgi:LemA protein